MPTVRLVAPAPDERPLDLLLEDLVRARQDVDRLRRAPSDPRGMLAARKSLLGAMESYAAALTERGLPTPWRLRDDLRLQRSLGTPRHLRGGRR